MGQSYSVSLTCKYWDEDYFCLLTRKFLKENGIEPYWNFHEYQELPSIDDNKELRTVDGCVKSMLHGFADAYPFSKTLMRNGDIEYANAFESSYGWEPVIDEWFQYVAPSLEDGSEIFVAPDEGDWQYTVEGGVAKATPIPKYTINELRERDKTAFGYAIYNVGEECCFELGDKFNKPSGELTDDEVAEFATEEGMTFYGDGRIASYL